MHGILYRIGRVGNFTIQAAMAVAQLYLAWIQGGKPGVANAILLIGSGYVHVKALETEPPPKK